jgi:hypothetical protein
MSTDNTDKVDSNATNEADLIAEPSRSEPQQIINTLDVDGRQWQLASYHPHQNGGGPPWDQMRHGFHTYLDHLIAWLAKLN